MTPEQEIAWAAGLFEGEGCFSHGGDPSAPRVQMRLGMCDRDVVERFARIVGVGRIALRAAQPQKNQREFWDWGVSGDDAVALAERLLPFLGERRTRRGHETLDARRARVEQATVPRACRNCGAIFSPTYSKQASRRVFCGIQCNRNFHGRAHTRRKHAGVA